MKLSKHENHRNANYLKWLRTQPCAASAAKSDCAHHIRIGTNGGSSLKPSDYFCIPLTNDHHTTGLFALHIIGEETFLSDFKLDKNELFVYYLRAYLAEKLDIKILLEKVEDEVMIAYMIEVIEENRTELDRSKKKKKTKKSNSGVKARSVTESEFYQKAKEAKKIKDKELRLKIKEDKAEVSKTTKKTKKTKSVTESEFYQKSKEAKKIKDKELRLKIKEDNAKLAKTTKKSTSLVGTEFYEKAKEEKRIRDKELRLKLKKSQKSNPKNASQTEYYEKAKELKRIRDKEFRDKLKEQRKAKKKKKF